MKKLTYLVVMIVGMTLASANLYAQDAKSTTAPVKKEAATCCKSGEKMADGKTCSKSCAKDASATTQKADDKSGTCSKSKTATTSSEAKVSKTVN